MSPFTTKKVTAFFLLSSRASFWSEGCIRGRPEHRGLLAGARAPQRKVVLLDCLHEDHGVRPPPADTGLQGRLCFWASIPPATTTMFLTVADIQSSTQIFRVSQRHFSTCFFFLALYICFCAISLSKCGSRYFQASKNKACFLKGLPEP